MPLSAPQLAILQNIIGDPGEEFLDEDALNALYDSPDFANEDFTMTVVWALRQLVGLTAPDTSVTSPNTQLSVSKGERHDHYVALLEDWESRAGVAGVGVVSLSTSITTPTRSDLYDPTDDIVTENW